MRKRAIAWLCFTACYAGCASLARSEEKDSLQSVMLQEVQIVSNRATAKTPVAFSDIKKEQIAKGNAGLDLPFLMTTTPSVLITSDAGNGVGYTSIRVRGTDGSRINITANDIPLNDAESHTVYWVNTPDFASSLEDIQVQRGAGTSSNGAGAFGASLNMRTQGISATPYAELSGSYGSFNTQKQTVKIGSGMLHNHWAFDGRISQIKSDGYRDRASSDLKSYFLQGGYFGERTSVKFITFGGKEETYHAWDGISREMLKSNRRYNPNGLMLNGKDTIGYYNNQIDYYKQTHYQLLVNHTFSDVWKMYAALHYTDGEGYYEEYKNNRTLVEYALTPFELDGVTQHKSNLVRRKWVQSGFGGGVFHFNYNQARWDATVGGGLNHYSNDHFGKVLWVKNYVGFLDTDHEYYRNKGRKTDANIYAKANFDAGKGVNVYADLQYRYIRYKIDGMNDVWDWTANPEQMQTLAIDEDFNFFNPKAGVSWEINPHQSVYASFGVAQKEPTRNNYTDGLLNEHPSAEKLFDYEAGYTYRNKRFTAGVNLYYMDYTDQLLLNGKLNEIGEAMSENVKDSYRMGIELSAGYKFTDFLRWDINATWSKNRVKNYVAYLSDYDDAWNDMYTQTALELGDTPIAFSPSFMAGSHIVFSLKGWEAALQSQYVSRQYLDNSGDRENSLDAYFVNHLNMSYTFKLPATKSISVGAVIYNLFNTKYETNGYSQSAAIYANGDKSNPVQVSNDPRFYPMAGTNVLCHLTLRF